MKINKNKSTSSGVSVFFLVLCFLYIFFIFFMGLQAMKHIQNTPDTCTSMKNGYSIIGLRIEKDPFSKDIFSNFTPLCVKTRRYQSLNLPTFLQNKDIFRNFTPFWMKTRRNQGLNLPHFSYQIKPN